MLVRWASVSVCKCVLCGAWGGSSGADGVAWHWWRPRRHWTQHHQPATHSLSLSPYCSWHWARLTGPPLHTYTHTLLPWHWPIHPTSLHLRNLHWPHVPTPQYLQPTPKMDPIYKTTQYPNQTTHYSPFHSPNHTPYWKINGVFNQRCEEPPFSWKI